MGERCVNNPTRDCSAYPLIVKLEERVNTLEIEKSKQEKFRKDFYEEREKRIARDTKLDMLLEQISNNVEDLVNWKNSQIQKPIKQFDEIKKTFFIAISSAAGGFLFSYIINMLIN